MNRITKCLAWLCIITCCLSCVGCEKKAEAQPILKVITSSQIGVTIFSYKRYYDIYDNGKKKKIPEFSPTEVERYAFQTSTEESVPYLYHIDLNSVTGIEINNIAKSIVSLTDENEKITSQGKLFLIDGRYYFTASVDKGKGFKVTLLEYLIQDNSIEEIATFKGDITHVEAYQ